MTALETAGTASLDGIAVDRVMHTGFVSCPLETPLVAIARLLAEHRVHCVVGYGDAAEDDTRLWGLISDLDVIAALAAGEGASTAGEIAASEIVAVAPFDSVAQAVRLMNDHGVTHLLVVDPGSDRPLGVVSTLDVAMLVAGVSPAAPRSGSRVDDLMTSPALSVPPELPLKDVAELLVEHGISGVPVVSDGEVVGVVSEGDLILKEGGSPSARRRARLAPLRRGDAARLAAKESARTAGEAMTAPAVTTAPWRSAAAAAALMAERGIKRLPVVRNGVLVGVVTRTDLVRAFARTDAELEREIREDVLRRSFWIDPTDFVVTVDRGVVRLAGDVPSELERELVPRAVERVPGVVAVSADLRPADPAGSYRRLHLRT